MSLKNARIMLDNAKKEHGSGVTNTYTLVLVLDHLVKWAESWDENRLATNKEKVVPGDIEHSVFFSRADAMAAVERELIDHGFAKSTIPSGAIVDAILSVAKRPSELSALTLPSTTTADAIIEGCAYMCTTAAPNTRPLDLAERMRKLKGTMSIPAFVTASADELFEYAAIELDKEADQYERNYKETAVVSGLAPWDMLRKAAKWTRALKGQRALAGPNISEFMHVIDDFSAAAVAWCESVERHHSKTEQASRLAHQRDMRVKVFEALGIALRNAAWFQPKGALNPEPFKLDDATKLRAVQAANKKFAEAFRYSGYPEGTLGAMRDAVCAALDAVFLPAEPKTT